MARATGIKAYQPWAPFAVQSAACPVARVPGSALSNAYRIGFRQLFPGFKSLHEAAPVTGWPSGVAVVHSALLTNVGVKASSLTAHRSPRCRAPGRWNRQTGSS